jgi:hypothetical protein
MDRDQRREIAWEIHRLINADQPCLFLFTPRSLVLVSSRFRNVNITQLGARAFDWWIPE